MIRTGRTEEADYEQLELLEAIEKNMGVVPDLLRILTDSSVVFRTRLGFHDIADELSKN